MNSDRLKLLGEILVHQGHCTLTQVNEARRIQLFTRSKRPLGQILVAMGAVRPEQVEEARRRQTFCL